MKLKAESLSLSEPTLGSPHSSNLPGYESKFNYLTAGLEKIGGLSRANSCISRDVLMKHYSKQASSGLPRSNRLSLKVSSKPRFPSPKREQPEMPEENQESQLDTNKMGFIQGLNSFGESNAYQYAAHKSNENEVREGVNNRYESEAYDIPRPSLNQLSTNDEPVMPNSLDSTLLSPPQAENRIEATSGHNFNVNFESETDFTEACSEYSVPKPLGHFSVSEVTPETKNHFSGCGISSQSLKRTEKPSGHALTSFLLSGMKNEDKLSTNSNSRLASNRQDHLDKPEKEKKNNSTKFSASIGSHSIFGRSENIKNSNKAKCDEASMLTSYGESFEISDSRGSDKSDIQGKNLVKEDNYDVPSASIRMNGPHARKGNDDECAVSRPFTRDFSHSSRLATTISKKPPSSNSQDEEASGFENPTGIKTAQKISPAIRGRKTSMNRTNTDLAPIHSNPPFGCEMYSIPRPIAKESLSFSKCSTVARDVFGLGPSQNAEDDALTANPQLCPKSGFSSKSFVTVHSQEPCNNLDNELLPTNRGPQSVAGGASLHARNRLLFFPHDSLVHEPLEHVSKISPTLKSINAPLHDVSTFFFLF